MKWIREHKLIAGLLSLLIILALIFALSVTTGFGEGSFSAFINNGVSKVVSFLSSAGGEIRDGAGGIFAGNRLRERIEELEEENGELERQLAQAKLDEEEMEQLLELARILDYDYTSQTFDVVSANVAFEDGSNWNAVFTIDRGTESGIEAGDTVVDGDGLVGFVADAGEGWAKVRPAISTDETLSFRLARDSGQLGIVSGNSEGIFSGYMLDDESTVVEGDIIISSGMGSCPRGIEIGSVRSVSYNSNRLIREITVEPAVDFKSLRKVAVIV